MRQFALGLLLLTVGVGLVDGASKSPKGRELARLRDEVGGLRELLTLSSPDNSASERLRGVSWSSQVQQPEEAVLLRSCRPRSPIPTSTCRRCWTRCKRVSNLQGSSRGLAIGAREQKPGADYVD